MSKKIFSSAIIAATVACLLVGSTSAAHAQASTRASGSQNFRSQAVSSVTTNSSVNAPESDFWVDESKVEPQEPASDEYVLWDETGELVSDAQRHTLETEGLAPEEISIPEGTWAAPSAQLREAAGQCEIPLGADVNDALQGCASSTEDDNPPSPEIPDLNALSGSEYGPIGMWQVKEPPAECISATSGVRYLSRYQACFSTNRVVDLVDKQGKKVGSIRIEAVSALLGGRSVYATNKTWLKYSDYTGQAVGKTFDYRWNYSCWQGCEESYERGQNFAIALNPNKWVDLERNLLVTSASGSNTAVMKENFSFTTTATGVLFSAQTTAAAIGIRCDRGAVSGIGPACVHSAVVPSVKLSTSGAEGPMAIHVQKAIASGLPSTLTRISPSLVSANRNKACPSSLTRQPNYECDEYPFASSQQGAASGGSARVFQGCIWSPIAGAGSVGFSRCQVPGAANREGGRILSAVYLQSHVLPGDKYSVRVTG